jgi:hypothetical protein
MSPLAFAALAAFYVYIYLRVVFRFPGVMDTRLLFSAHRAGLMTFCDFVTKFGGDVSLLTTSSGSAGAVKRPPRRHAQIFKNLDYTQMFEEHCRARPRPAEAENYARA